MKNIIYDTNAFLYLFELVKNKGYTIPTTCLNKEYFIQLAQNNAGFVSSTTLFELLLKCVERNPENWYPQFEDYFFFIRDYFPNEQSILNEETFMKFDFNRFRSYTDENIREFLDEKIKGEKDILYIFLSALVYSITFIFLDIFGDKVHNKNYSRFKTTQNKNMKEELYKLCQQKYKNGEMKNEVFDRELDKILFRCIYDTLFYLARNYPISESDLAYLDCVHSDLYSKLEKMLSNLNSNSKYNDIKEIIEVLNKNNYPNKDEGYTIFLQLSDNPDCKQYIKPHKKNIDKGTEYIRQVLITYERKKSKPLRKYVKKYLSDVFCEKPFESYSENSKLYIRYILELTIDKQRTIKKNDVIDYLIATLPDYVPKNFSTDTTSQTVILTFDTTLKDFIKETKTYYDSKIYTNITLNTKNN